MKAVAEKLAKRIESLRLKRYPTMLVADSDSSRLTAEDAKAVAQSCSLRFVDYRSDVLTTPDCEIILGAYMRGQFLEWLISEARSSGGLLVRRADEVIASWPDAERKAFLLEFLRTECNDPKDSTQRAPIVLVSRFVKKYALPRKERGQGLIVDLADEEGGQLNG